MRLVVLLSGVLPSGCKMHAPCGSRIPVEPPARGPAFGGKVFVDQNRDGRHSPGEPGISGVMVSNGHDVTRTDTDGHYSLPRLDAMVVFVTKPSGYRLPLQDGLRHAFYYTHRPSGSPPAVRTYPGIEPTGELPRSVDFGLVESAESDSFRLLAIGDTQPKNQTQLSYLRDSLPPSAQREQADFALVMGDLVHNDLGLYPRYIEIMSLMATPSYFVPGNHDLNFDARNDASSLETYTHHFGPSYYSFDYGRVHFVVLDSVWKTGSGKSDYRGELDPHQLAWLERDLAFVPNDRLIVLSMHIPLVCWIGRDNRKGRSRVCNADALYSLLEGRKVLALAGHTHTVENFAAGHREPEWGDALPFPQLIVGAASGSWWNGPLGPDGVPQALQRDGAPKGFYVIDFDGTSFTPRFETTSGHSENMWLSVGDRDGALFPNGFVDAGKSAFLFANIWGAPTDADVIAQVGQWKAAAVRQSDVPDPLARAMQREMRPRNHMRNATHLWVAELPKLSPGIHTLNVKAEDRYGNRYTGTLSVESR